MEASRVRVKLKVKDKVRYCNAVGVVVMHKVKDKARAR